MEVPDYGIYASKDWPNAQKGLAAMISYLDKDVATLRAKLEELGILVSEQVGRETLYKNLALLKILSGNS